MSETFKVLFLGDLVGRPGREAVIAFLNNEIKEAFVPVPDCSQYDFVIANVENASHGFGLTSKNHDALREAGVCCMTSGNHIWDKKDIYSYIKDSNALIRPVNYHKTAQGVGYRIFNDKVVVINLLGKTFMQPVVCPFQSLYDTLKEIQSEIELEDKIVIVDFHAEATAEKICFAHFARKLGVSAVFGTHTHVQTADEKLIDFDFELGEDFEFLDENNFKVKEKTAYISDVGFCGTYESVIGMEYESSLKKLVTSIPERFDVAQGSRRQINAVSVQFDLKTGSAVEIERINFIVKQQTAEAEIKDEN